MIKTSQIYPSLMVTTLLVLSSTACLAKNLTLLLDQNNEQSSIQITATEFIEKNSIKTIANKRYQYFSVKKADGMIYEAYIVPCAPDYLVNLDKNEAKTLQQCTDQVINAVDELMHQTKNSLLHFSGTQYVYDGYEDSSQYHYYSFFNVKNYSRSNDGKRPLLGVIYRCKVKASAKALKPFIEQAKNSCANTMIEAS
ncbi:hypothetical protein NQU59_12950 [Acinetobacter colistiniresistens]|uniref:hypothetical protein n=1 Tax=Acinetobacter TaxID=469 RepID=UPI0005C562C1|nr:MULTISPECIES: hypothetical protein [Acinetobacter]UUM26597.1 hypothetical protein NQU59_12950 [Acinetobacter colistiniresistens]